MAYQSLFTGILPSATPAPTPTATVTPTPVQTPTVTPTVSSPTPTNTTPVPKAPITPAPKPATNLSGVPLSQLGVGGFLNGVTASAPKTVPPPTVVTAKPATEDLQNKQAALEQATTAQTQQTANVAANTANAQANAQDTTKSSTPSLEDISSGKAGAEGANATNSAIAAVQASADAAYQDFAGKIAQIQNGTFPLTPSQQAQINATQQSFEQLKAAQTLANKNFEGQVRLSGLNGVAPAINLSIVKNAVDSGIQKIASLDSQASKAVADLQEGFMKDDYQMINDAYTAASNLFAQKTSAINDMNTNVRNATSDALAQHAQAVTEAQQKLDNQKAAVQFAQQNGITAPYYLLGNTAIDTKTGLPVSLAEYQKATGQQVGLPPEQTDFSKIQHIADPAVLNLQKQYGDAGILATDSIDQAKAKLANSALYRKDTYIAPPAGSGGGADTVSGLAQQLVSGLLAPAELSKRSTGVGSYSSILDAADKISMATTGKHFDIAKADRDYKFANAPATLNTLNYLGSLIGGNGQTGNLDNLKTLSDTVGRTKFPALNDVNAWAKLQTGNPTIVAYNATVTEVADQIAKILQGGGTGSGTSDAKLSQAESLFQKSFSKDQVNATIDAIKPLLNNRAKSIVGDNPYLSDYADQFGFSKTTTNSVGAGSVIEYNGQQYNVDAQGNLTPVK